MTSVVMEEIPDKVTLAVDISNCTGLCEGCHSPFLRTDIGLELTPERVESMLADNFGVNCFLFSVKAIIIRLLCHWFLISDHRIHHWPWPFIREGKSRR